VTIDLGTAGAIVTWSVVLSGVVALLTTKRMSDLVELYQKLFEGKSAENAELTARLERVETQLAFYQSDFTAQLAEGITKAIVDSVERHIGERAPHEQH
jgi:hypothetical protein